MRIAWHRWGKTDYNDMRIAWHRWGKTDYYDMRLYGTDEEKLTITS